MNGQPMAERDGIAGITNNPHLKRVTLKRDRQQETLGVSKPQGSLLSAGRHRSGRRYCLFHWVASASISIARRPARRDLRQPVLGILRQHAQPGGLSDQYCIARGARVLPFASQPKLVAPGVVACLRVP